MGYSVRFEAGPCAPDERCDGSCAAQVMRSIDTQPPMTSHFMAYVNVSGIEPTEPIVVSVAPNAYRRTICEACLAERCWLPEEEALFEHVEDYPNVMTYSHYCLCECHEPMDEESSYEEWEDDDYGDY